MATGARPPLTSFVGRRTELATLRSLLGSSGMVTITGPGGSGKTRLAEELAAILARPFNGDVAIAYLANAGGPGEVVDVIAGAVGLRGRVGGLRDALVDYLRPRRLLLVMDNCEHLRDESASVAAELLRSCPGVTILATSRRSLLVPGEQLFPLDGLPADAAVTLFEDRARKASPAFALADTVRPRVSALCARLDGMPLAIELAAARVRSVGIVELMERLDGHLTDLDSGATVVPKRQQSLRGAISWSHDLMDGAQRALWRRLCIFSGGFTLEAAEEVAALPPIDRAAIEKLLEGLVDQSMVVFDAAQDRYRVIEAMREYGLERLRDDGEAAVIATRHHAWMLALAEDVDRRWFGPHQPELSDRMQAEAGNLRVALESCREAGTDDVGLRLATASLWFWVTRASLSEAARWFATFLDRVPDEVLDARARWRAGYVAVLSGRYAEARTLLERAERTAEQSGDLGTRVYARIISCLRTLYEQTDDEVLAVMHEALADPAADAQARSWALIGIGLASFAKEDWDECRRASVAGIEMCRAIGESWSQELHLRSLAYAEWQSGTPEIAESALLEALRIDRRLDDVWHRAWTTEVLAWVTLDLGGPERAARLIGIASGLFAQSGAGLAGAWRAYHVMALDRLRERLGDERLAQEIATGAALDRAGSIAFVLGDATPPDPDRRARGALSARELEVAGMVAGGSGNREIAERLFLSPRTVEKHVEHLMNKLGVNSRAEIATWHARQEVDRPSS